MDSQQDEILQRLVKYKRKPYSRTTPIGKSVDKYFNGVISKNYEKMTPVVKTVKNLLTPNISAHCRVKDLQQGKLTIEVDNPVYMHELRMCAPELLKEIKRTNKSSRVRYINFVIGSIVKKSS
jgi:hypothetical protein